MRELIINECGPEVYDYMNKFVDTEAKSTLVVRTSTVFNIVNNPIEYDVIINLKRMNDFRFINKVLEGINAKLKNGDLFIACVETYAARKNKKRIRKVPVLRNIYFGMEFIFMRVFPKLPGFKKIYFFATKGRNRVLSKAEAFGRLASCGFEIYDYESFDGLMYIVTKKIKQPAFNMSASYGPLYKMPRMGKNGKIIGVYKLRTMHPYAEYLQDYVLKINGYAESGKPANDFRLTPWGKFLRRYWLDELPQLLNVVKGELKLVGVRPISERYYKDIPRDLQLFRRRFKPGCIPPYVALNREGNVDSVLQSEREYLKEKMRQPYTTDLKYFFKAISNIVFKRKRSA
ncbi:MAG: sugar transferase [Bacteroidetes bacterium]|nr:sugar transferase [Bacteroidota bacterium]